MKLPKITINKEYTTIAQVDQVREDAAQFREMYTAGDLKTAFMDATDCYGPYSEEIIKVEIECFPGGTDYNDETRFHVKMITDGFTTMHKVSFYCDMWLNIDTRTIPGYQGKPMPMYECKEFQQV